MKKKMEKNKRKRNRSMKLMLVNAPIIIGI